jgi:hypothetical protein
LQVVDKLGCGLGKDAVFSDQRLDGEDADALEKPWAVQQFIEVVELLAEYACGCKRAELFQDCLE